MSSNDRLQNELLKAVEELTKTLKNSRRPLAERNTKASRVGRGGAANAKNIRDSAEDMTALIDGLKEVHRSAKMGSIGLSSFLKTIKSVANPLADTFRQLDKVVDKISENASKRELEAAKTMRDLIKANNGNIDVVKDATKKYAEYVAHVNDMAALQKSKVRDEQAVKAALAKELELREDLNKLGFKGVASDAMKKYFKFLEQKDRRLGTTGLDELNKELGKTNKQFEAMNNVAKDFTINIQEMQKKMDGMMKEQLRAFGNNLWTAVKADIAKIPNIVTSRLQTGMVSNEIIDSIRLGLSAEDLNKFRASNKDVLNSLSGFRPGSNLVDDTNLLDRASELKRAGLTGTGATEYLSQAMRASFNSGRAYDAETAQNMLRDSKEIQQAFGGTITEANARLNDYSSQIFNLQKFAQVNSKEEQATLEKELKTRLLLVKAMGYDIEYLKQQEMMRHNAQFGEITDRIRGAVMGEVSSQVVGDQLGWTQEQKALWSKARRPGVKLNEDELIAAKLLEDQVGRYKQSYEANAAQGGLNGYVGSLTPNILLERTIGQSGGASLQQMTDASITADIAKKNMQGMSPDDYVKFISATTDKQAESIGMFEDAVMSFKTIVEGAKSSVAGSTLGTIASFGIGAAGALATKAIFGRVLGKVLGGSGGGGFGGLLRRFGTGGGGGFIDKAKGTASGILGRFGIGGGATGISAAASRVTPPPIPGATNGSLLSRIGVKGAGKSLAKKIPIIGGLLGLGFGAGRLMDGDGVGAGLEVASGAASTIPLIGTAASVGLDAVSIARDEVRAKDPNNSTILDDVLKFGAGMTIPGLGTVMNTSILQKYLSPSIMGGVDTANNVQRDPKTGEIINNDGSAPSKEISLLEQLVALLTEQNKEVAEGNNMARAASEYESAVQAKQQSVQAHIENLSQSYGSMFSVS